VNTDLLALQAGGALAALLVAYVVARRLMAAGYSWADALVVEAVAVIGGIGAVQSYTALRWLALLGDLPEWRTRRRPPVDLFAVVMGLAALRARRAGARDCYADRLALGYSVAAVLANLAAAGLDVSQHPQYTAARAVVVLLAHAGPVVTFLLGSHWLMGRRMDAGTVTSADGAAPSGAADRAGPMSADVAGQPVRTVDTAEDIRADMPGAIEAPAPAGDAPAAPAAAARTRPPARDRVRRLLRINPDIAADDVAKRCGVSVPPRPPAAGRGARPRAGRAPGSRPGIDGTARGPGRRRGGRAHATSGARGRLRPEDGQSVKTAKAPQEIGRRLLQVSARAQVRRAGARDGQGLQQRRRWRVVLRQPLYHRPGPFDPGEQHVGGGGDAAQRVHDVGLRDGGRVVSQPV
jgi:hypothetical protein